MRRFNSIVIALSLAAPAWGQSQSPVSLLGPLQGPPASLAGVSSSSDSEPKPGSEPKLLPASASESKLLPASASESKLLPASASESKVLPAAKSDGTPTAPTRELPKTVEKCLGECDNACKNLDGWCGQSFLGCGVPSRWSARIDAGDGIGYTRGFAYLEGFVPLYQREDSSLWFGDVRVVNFLDGDRWEFNAGTGYRTPGKGQDVVWGANIFYDGRGTDANFFHQIGAGAEAIFGNWEARCNGYFVVGNHRQVTADITVANAVGTQLFLDRYQISEIAMSGFDVEVGGLLAVLPRFSPRAFIGFYHYSAEGMSTANGIRGRLEAWVNSNCSLHFAVQNDGVFDTTVTGGVALHFGGAKIRPGEARSLEERLGQRVVRDVNVVVAERIDLLSRRAMHAPKVGVGAVHVPEPPPPDPPGSEGEPPPSPPPPGPPPPNPPPPNPPICLPFPGAPGNPATFPGNHYPPGFHHDCFPGRGRYKHVWDEFSALPHIRECSDDKHH